MKRRPTRELPDGQFPQIFTSEDADRAIDEPNADARCLRRDWIGARSLAEADALKPRIQDFGSRLLEARMSWTIDSYTSLELHAEYITLRDKAHFIRDTQQSVLRRLHTSDESDDD